ncbi:acyl-CoA carboxylase subunit epsilon, partial [Streptomyces humidus]|uniref:acyl-CoA carboxylase subunit epsilon n=1 Tax=Streptomyces humidus TaxID=52259 RepID=UPI003319A5B1
MDIPEIRVTKGHAEPEEVAALTAALLVRAAAPPVPDEGPVRALWRRLEREPGFRAAHSWTYLADDPHGDPAYVVHFDSRSPDGTIYLNR